MTVAQFNYFYRVDITFARYTGESSTATTTVSFVNKALKDSTSSTTYWPIFKSIGEVSVSAGELLPNISLSAVEIDNRIGTFGANRKLSDILQRYTPVEQTIVFYGAQVFNDLDSVTTWTQFGQGVVTSWEATSGDEEATIRFDVRSAKYSELALNFAISRDVTGMANAPESSLGRFTPLLVGDNLEVIPIRISADGGSSANYVVGTCFYNLLRNRYNVAKLHTKNYLDEWEEIKNDFTDRSLSTITGSYTLNTYASRAIALEPQSGNSGLTVGVHLRVDANGLASSTAKLTVFILQYNPTTKQVVDEAVAIGTADLANYNSQNSGSSEFGITVSFERPAFLSASLSYALGWSVTGYQVGDLGLYYVSPGASTFLDFVRDVSDSNSSSGFGWKVSTSGNPLKADLSFLSYDATLQDHFDFFNQNGLTYSRLDVSPDYSADSGQANPAIDNVPLLLTGIQGLSTYSGYTLKNKPHELAELLSYTWNGSSWTNANLAWDTSTLSSSHYDKLYNGASPNFRSRVARGVFEGRVTYSQFLAELCRGTASRVGVLSTGKSFMYPFGATVTPAFDIPAHDIIGLTWEQRGIETVINRANIKTNRSYLYAPRSFEGGESVGYQYNTDYSAVNHAQVRDMTLESRALYGNRELSQGEFLISPDAASGLPGYLGNSSSQGSILAEYYIGRFGKPLVYCSFVVPYHRYNTVRMFDVITFTSVQFPAYYGVDPNARDGVVDTGSGNVTPVTTADGGYETVRAQTYRGLVEGISFVLAMEHAPAVRLTVQVLLNPPYDPT